MTFSSQLRLDSDHSSTQYLKQEKKQQKQNTQSFYMVMNTFAFKALKNDLAWPRTCIIF